MRPSETGRRLLLAAGLFAIGTDVFSITAILPGIAVQFGVEAGPAGWVVTAYMLAYGLGGPVVAVVAAGIPAERLAIVALGLFAMASALTATATSFAELLLWRALAGVAACAYTPTAYALAASAVAPGTRGRALAFAGFGMSFAGLVGVPVAFWVGDQLEWRLAFWILFCLAASTVAMWVLGPLEHANSYRAFPRKTSLSSLASRRFFWALLPSMLWNAAAYTSYTYLGVRLADAFTPATVALLFFVYGAGGVTGSFAGGALASRLSARHAIVAWLLVAACNQVAFAMVDGSVLFIGVILIVWAISGWGLFVAQQTLLVHLALDQSRPLLALNSSIIYLGASIGAAFGGYLLRIGLGVAQLPWIAGVLMMLSLFAFLIAQRAATDDE